MTNFSEAQLRSIVDRILRLKAEQDELTSDVRGIYAEAKSQGFDKTAIGAVVTEIRKRTKDPNKHAERAEMASTYLDAYERASHAPARGDKLGAAE